MPRTLPPGMETFLKKQGGTSRLVILLDVQTTDGATFFWSDFEGTYPGAIVAGNQFYSGWIKNAAPFKRARDLSTSAGDLTLQNLSGNTIDRDVSTALKSHEFEGALAIMRLWLPLFDDVMEQSYCSLSEQNPTEDECSFRILQIFDPAQYDVAGDIISELCTLRFKGAHCGSTGTATFCLKRLVQDCQDPSRAAQERFNGVLTTVPNTGINPPLIGPGGIGFGPDPGDGGSPFQIVRT